MVRGGKTPVSPELKAVLNSVLGITAVSASLLNKMLSHFKGGQVSHLLQEECSVTVADGRAIVSREQTQPVQVTL